MLTGLRMRMAEQVSIAAVVAAILLRSAASLAVPPGFTNEVVVPGIAAATTMAFLPDGRMLVGELTRRIWVVQPGASAPDPIPFLQLDTSIEIHDEQGLMDVLPDPNYAVNQRYYVFYTAGIDGGNHNRVSRFTASGNTTNPATEVVLWQDPVIALEEHHGGALAFGADGKLYITVGEQFSPSDAQLLNNYRGKLLRINLDGTIPTDNPFYDGAGSNKDEIFARGLRNPFRMSFDSVSGRLFIADVGGNDPNTAMEEINLAAAGANYGWPLCEGSCAQPGVTSPIHSYPHLGRDASITGGFVYRGTQFPVEYRGDYFFADYAQNWIKRLTFDTNGNVTGVVAFEPLDGAADGPYGDPAKLIQGPDGSLYYVDIGFDTWHDPNEAAIRRIRFTSGNQPPVVAADGTPRSGPAPLLVAFTSAGSFDPEGLPLSYAWTFGDGGTSTQANPTHSYATEGTFVARLTVSDGPNPTTSGAINISVGSPPTANILSPSEGAPFRAGDGIGYSGSGSDPEDGTLPASAFSWTIFFRHDTHMHPAGGPFVGSTTGTLSIPTTGHDYQGNTRYEIVLTVTDSDGLQGTDSVTVYPDKVDLSFQTVPIGLSVDLDGVRRATPFVVDDLIGFQHVLAAPAQQSGGTSYTFASWSDGGAASHTIIVPANDATYTATFQQGPSGLVAGYAFQEAGGSSATDASGFGNDGSLSGATRTTSGKYGSALLFDGVDDLVVIPDSNSLDLTLGMTLEAWVYPSAVMSYWRSILHKQVDAYFLHANSTANRPMVGGIFGGSCCTILQGTSALPANQWTHLAGTYDGATLRLYVNGVQQASQARTGSLEVNGFPVHLGGNTYAPSEHFSGRIDEVRIYNRALSVSEIQGDMNTPLPEPGKLLSLLAGSGVIGLLRRRARRRGY